MNYCPPADRKLLNYELQRCTGFPGLLEQMTTGRSDNRKYSQTGGGSVGLKSACQRGLLKGFTGVFTAACLSLVVPDHPQHVNV